VLTRPFPYPFASALTVVSDVDGAAKARYDGYMGDLVHTYGLDFGDSMWLRTCCETPASDVPIAAGLGFFSRFFGVGNKEAARTFVRVRTLIESVAEFHTGNVDHYHSFLNKGPRVAILEGGEVTADAVTFALTAHETQGFWRCTDNCVDAVCVVLRGAPQSAIESITLTERGGQVIVFDRPIAPPENDAGETLVMFATSGSVEDDVVLPRMEETVQVRVAVPGGKADVVRVLLVSGSTHTLLDRLRYLRDRFNVETPLVTEHSAFHMRAALMGSRRDAEQDKYIAEHPGVVAALNGAHSTPEKTLVFSTEADDPRSFARVLPELPDEFEVRFMVPQAATNNAGISIDKVIVPLSTRAGTVVYQVHRTMPNVLDTPQNNKFDGTFSRQENFHTRIDKALDMAEAMPGLYWPIYTHLGGFSTPVADNAIPKPYFEGTALARLQDHVYNVTGSVPSTSRIWMARSTVFYDYILIRRFIADHTKLADPNTVEITSWHDPVLNKTLPRSTSQLYGQTFYVADPTRARVLVDGKPVRLLARNGADEMGRCSVTVCDSEIRHVVFDALDPLQKAGLEAQLLGGNWRFTRAEKDKPAFGRLTVTRGQSASLSVPMHGWGAVGSQLLSLIGGRSKSGAMGLVLETVSGGRFFFGDRALLDAVGPVNAHYVFEYDQGTGLRDMAAPFHCMTWAEGSTTGGPMPSHPLTSITLHCAGGRGAYADFGDLALLRPRATSLNHGETTSYCLGGVVPGFKPGLSVHAQAKGKSEVVATPVDQRGWFCFTQLPEGIYNVWTEGETAKIYDRRGPLVELRADVMTLELKA
jgi:hypothetical protein